MACWSTRLDWVTSISKEFKALRPMEMVRQVETIFETRFGNICDGIWNSLVVAPDGQLDNLNDL